MDSIIRNNRCSSRFIMEISSVSLSGKMQNLITRYNKIAPNLFQEPRKDFIWKWLKVGLEKTVLDCVDEELKERVLEIVQQSIMIVVLIDDIVDQLQDEQFLTDALRSVGEIDDRPNRTGGDRDKDIVVAKEINSHKKDYLVLIKEVWDCLNQQLTKLPRFKAFQANFEQAYGEYWKAFRQAFDLKSLAKHKGTDLLHLGDHETIGNVEKRLSYNMHIVIGDIIMLMGSPKFDERDFEHALDFFLYDQVACNLENDWYTFPLELKQGDFASALMLYAIDQGYITPEQIEQIAANPGDAGRLQEAINTVRDKCEGYVRDKRLRLLEMRAKIGSNIRSFDAVEALRRSFETHKNMHEQLGSFITLLK